MIGHALTFSPKVYRPSASDAGAAASKPDSSASGTGAFGAVMAGVDKPAGVDPAGSLATTAPLATLATLSPAGTAGEPSEPAPPASDDDAGDETDTPAVLTAAPMPDAILVVQLAPSALAPPLPVAAGGDGSVAVLPGTAGKPGSVSDQSAAVSADPQTVARDMAALFATGAVALDAKTPDGKASPAGDARQLIAQLQASFGLGATDTGGSVADGGSSADRGSGGDSAPAPAATPATTQLLPQFQVAPASAAVDTSATSSATIDPKPIAETVMEHKLDMARDGEWLDRLAKDISAAATQDSRLRFQISPAHLGSLQVELANGAEGTAIKLTTDSEAARNILVDAQPRLVAEARAQGMRISDTQIDLGNQGGGQWGGQAPGQGGAGSRSNQGMPDTWITVGRQGAVATVDTGKPLSDLYA